MPHRFQFLYALSLMALLLAACGGTPTQSGPTLAEQDLQDQIISRGMIRVATDSGYRPFSYINERGQLEGFDVDVAGEIGKKMNVKVEFVTPDWDTVVTGDRQDAWDIHVGSLPLTSEFVERFFLTSPYYYLSATFAVPADSAVQELSELNGQGICVVAGTPEEHYLRKDGQVDFGKQAVNFQIENPRVTTMTGDLDCPQAWAAGRTDLTAWLTTDLTLRAAQTSGLNVRPLGALAYRRGFVIAVSRRASVSGERLAGSISAYIADMQLDGSLRELSQKWFGADLTSP